jgi:hypothetical protein
MKNFRILMLDKSSPSDAVLKELTFAWIITGAMVFSLGSYLLIAHFAGPELQSQYRISEEQRVVLRTVLYVVAIVTLPITNLIRHVQLRLNQTMPGDTSAKNRYLITVLVSMVLVETIGIYGFLMFILGDEFNTLYILIGMSALGMFLYRPKQVEYESIVEALADKDDD